MLGDCPTIHVGGAHELFRRVIQQIHLRGLSNKFYRNSVVSFENCDFTRIWLRHVPGSRLGLETCDWACRHSSRIMYLFGCDCLP